MKNSLGASPAVFPMPVLMIATYNEDGTVDVMNMAWGGVCDTEMVALNLAAGHFADIQSHANDIERRLADDCMQPALIEENRRNLAQCKAHGLPYYLIDGAYQVEFEL